jgi:acyl carrier protein
VDGWDSFSHIRLVVAVETEFNVSLTATEVAALKNVGEFVSLLSRKVS